MVYKPPPMKVEVNSESGVKKTLSISIPEDEVRLHYDEALKKLSRSVELPGFRRGKAPRDMLERRFGESVEADVVEKLIRETVFTALEEHKLEPVTAPRITDSKRLKGDGLSYVAAVETKPVFEPKDYKGIKLKKPETEVKAEEEESVLNQVRDSQAVLKDRQGATAPVKGDFVVLSIRGIDDEGNLTEPDAEPKDRVYEVGDEMLHPALEKAVLAMSVGGKTPVTIEAPQRESEGAQTPKEIHVRVELKGIKEKVLPELNDEFARSAGDFENLEALRSRVRADLAAEHEERARAKMRQEILDTIVKAHPIELPESMVEDELRGLMNEIWWRLKNAGTEDIPDAYKEENLRPKLRKDAEQRVAQQLLLESIAEMESIEVPDSELNERMSRLAASSKVPTAELRSYYEKTGRLHALHFSMLANKTLDFLLDTAIIK